MERPEIQLFSNDTLGYNVFVSNYFVTKSFFFLFFIFPFGVSDGDAEFSQNNL